MPAPMHLPRLVDEGTDTLYLRAQVDGQERECEITKGQAWSLMFTLLGFLARACRG